MLDLNDLRVFEAVASERSFTAAGKRLGLPTSVVSRRIQRLEEAVGVALLVRTTRSVGLTDAGRLFLSRTEGTDERVQRAAQAVRDAQQAPSGVIRVTMPPDDDGVLWSLFSGFLDAHPGVDLHIEHTLNAVDLIQGQIDVALRGGTLPDSTDYVAKKLLVSRIFLAASPQYLERYGTPERVEDLEHHVGLCMDAWAPNALRRLDGDKGPVRLQMRNRVTANRLETARRAAMEGLGIAPLLELTTQSARRSGRLVEVLRGALPDEAPFWVLYRKDASAAVAALVRHLRAEAERRGLHSSSPNSA